MEVWALYVIPIIVAAYFIIILSRSRKRLKEAEAKLRETFIENCHLFNLTKDQAMRMPLSEMQKLIHRKYGV